MIKIKKCLSLILIYMIMVNTILPIVSNASALEEGDVLSLYEKKEVPHHLKAVNSNGSYYVKTSMVGYKDSKGKFKPAYCLNIEKPGVESANGGYDVKIDDLSNSDEINTSTKRKRIYTILKHGYNNQNLPYVTSQESAYQATKMAIYITLGQTKRSVFNTQQDTEGSNIVKAIDYLLDLAVNHTETYTAPKLSITKVKTTTDNGEYEREYSVSLNTTSKLNGYTVRFKGLPLGSTIEGKKDGIVHIIEPGIPIQISGSQNFIVKVPSELMTEDIKASLTIEAEVDDVKAFCGEATNNANVQSYTLLSDKTNVSKSASFNVEVGAELKIVKVDSDTGKKIPDTTFKIYEYDQDANLGKGKKVATVTTGDDGTASVDLTPRILYNL